MPSLCKICSNRGLLYIPMIVDSFLGRRDRECVIFGPGQGSRGSVGLGVDGFGAESGGVDGTGRHSMKCKCNSVIIAIPIKTFYLKVQDPGCYSHLDSSIILSLHSEEQLRQM